MYIYVYLHLSLYICICIYRCVYIYIYIYIYITVDPCISMHCEVEQSKRSRVQGYPKTYGDIDHVVRAVPSNREIARACYGEALMFK